MTWFVYTLISAFCIAAYSLVSRYLLSSKGDPRAFAFWTDLTGGLFLLFIVLFEKKFFIPSLIAYFFLIIVGIIAGTVDSLLMKGRQTEEVSKTSTIAQTGAIWALFGGIVFFNETITFLKLFGVGLIILGNLIVIWNKQKISLTLGIRYFLIGTLLANIGYLMDKYMSLFISPAFYKSIIFISAAFWMFLGLPNRFRRLTSEFKLRKGLVFITGILLALSMYFLMKAYQIGEASKILPVYSSSFVLAALAGILILKEKEKINQKIIGAIITLLGVIILKIF